MIAALYVDPAGVYAATIRAALGTCEYALLVGGNDDEAHEAIEEARLALDALLAESNWCYRRVGQ